MSEYLGKKSLKAVKPLIDFIGDNDTPFNIQLSESVIDGCWDLAFHKVGGGHDDQFTLVGIPESQFEELKD